MKIDQFSTMSLYIEMYIDGAIKPIGKGTAFTTKINNQNYLITNWHVVTGRDPETNEPIDNHYDPDYIEAWFFTNTIGMWLCKKIRLKDADGKNLWIEHPHGRQIDVVAIAFTPKDDVFIGNLDIETANVPIKIYPSKEVSIIGYPNGLSAGGKYPIWKKGHVASEMDLNFNNKPLFLIDATTRGGMSGSPVILRESGMVQMEKNSLVNGTFTKFLGIYSGRLDKLSEIGRVWKPITIKEIIENIDKNHLTIQELNETVKTEVINSHMHNFNKEN
jgi:Trypsin-like peptidase domain